MGLVKGYFTVNYKTLGEERVFVHDILDQIVICVLANVNICQCFVNFQMQF